MYIIKQQQQGEKIKTNIYRASKIIKHKFEISKS